MKTDFTHHLLARATTLAILLALVLPVMADDPPATFQHVVSNGSTNYTVDFSLHSVRGPNFSIQVQQSDGSFVTNTPAPVRTYIGTVQGLPGAMASGLVRSNGQIYYHVLFEDGTDWRNEGGSTVGGPAPWSPNWPDYITGPGGGGTNVWAAELGVDVPYAYYALNTNVDAALEMVEHCVNTVDLLYLRDACITHRLGRVVVRAASTQDPYLGFTTVDQHGPELNNQWNNVLPPSTYDVFLVLATEGGTGVTGGGGIGQNTYSACEHTAAGDFTGVWRHEVGHSWSLGHYDGNTPEGPTINSGNVLARMSGPEEARALQHRSDRVAFLDNLGPYSNSIPPRASLDRAEYLFGTTNVVIDVLANDHDANGQSLSIIGFATNSTQGGTVSLSAGTGPGGRDQLIYTPPSLLSSQVDLFTYRIADTEGREALGNVITRPGDPSAELLGYYSLNEGTGGTAFDASSYKRDGTLSGGAAWTNGVYGGGVFFDGVNDGIYLSSPNHPTNRFTITGWVKRSGNQLPWACLVFSRGANTVMGLNFGTAHELRYHWNDAGWDWDSGLVVPDNTWTFVALTVSPTEATIYMDSGSGMVSATRVAAHPVEELDANFAIGTDPARGDRPFKGAMDDVRIYARTMSAVEIAATRNGLGCPGDPSPAHLSQPPAVGFDLSWTPSPAATLHRVFFSTNYLAVRDGTVASSADQGTVTNSSWTPPALADGSYYWRIDSSDGTNWIAGPVWAFTIQPGTPSLKVVPFTFGNALSFNGINQYVSITNFGAIAPTNEVTVEFWAYANVVKSQSAFILSPDQSTNRLNGHISFSNGNTYWDFGNINTAGRLSYPNPSGTVSNWTHYAFVASSNGNFMRIYRNGVLDTSKAGMTPFRRGTYELRIGGDGGAFSFNGRLDDFRVWNTARSSNEIAANYNHPLVGNEPGLLLYYQFDAASGTVASNSATATSSAYNGTLVNAPAWQSSGAPVPYFADGTTNVVDAIAVSVPSQVYVGNNGPNTALIITNNGMFSNSGQAYIGYKSTNNLALVTGTGSLWTNSANLYVGYFGSGNQLVMRNGGVLANADGIVGFETTANSNVAVVTGTGSLWTNRANLYVGYFTSGNQLMVSSGGVVADGTGTLGFDNSSGGASNNVAVVTGAGSLWTNRDNLNVGYFGSGNQLVVSNGGVVASSVGILGVTPSSSDNVTVVTGTNALWTNSGDFMVGYNGHRNQLVVSDGGTVQAATAYVGLNGSSINNRVIVNGGNLIVTNSGSSGTLDVRRGTNVFNAGLIQTDNLVLNNIAGFFDFNGGTLITHSGTVNNGQPFVVGASGPTAAIFDVRSNYNPLVVNNDFTLGANTATGNQLLLTNGGALRVTGTSYVGVDAATTNNLVIVSGPNSLWTNSSEFYFGYLGSGNQLVVADGGALADGFAYIGLASSSSNNVVVVTGAGSTWTNTGDLRVGGFGSGNQLVVSNGGVVVSGIGYFAVNSDESSNNVATVTGPNSRWILNSSLNLGYLGSGNQLVVSDGGTVQATSAYVGVDSGSTNNRVTLDGGSVTVTGSLTINSNNMLAGDGTINGTVINLGNLAPGNPIGKLVLSNSPVLQGTVFMEISNTGGTPTNDQIQVAASLTYGGDLVVSKFGAEGPTAGDSFSLFSASGYSGSFTSVILPPLDSSLMWTNKLLLDGSIAVVQRPPPTISGAMQSGTNLVFNVSGGAPGGTYTLLTSTNVTLPLSSWSTNSTGSFDVFGGITITRGINPDEAQRYFNIRVP